MLFMGFLSWWYGAGWQDRVRLVKERLAMTIDYFSIGLLIKTLFSPFRQISAGKVKGSIEVRFRALLDRLISRAIGGLVRTTVLFVGIVSIVFQVLWGGIVLAGWAVVPLLPIIGLLLFTIGWVP